MAVNDVLILTRADESNFHAICNFFAGRKIRRSDNRRRNDVVTFNRKVALLNEQDYCCAHCGKAFIYAKGRYKDVTADHVIQFCYGGEANHHNIVLVHYACNLARASNYSMKIIEDHFGPIDVSLLDYVPVVSF